MLFVEAGRILPPHRPITASLAARQYEKSFVPAAQHRSNLLYSNTFPGRLPFTMRAKRSKKYRKLMHQYELTFNFREPYQVLGMSHCGA